MAVQNNYMTWTIQASAALTDLRAGLGEIYKAVGTTGKITATKNALGILQQGADDAGHITLAIMGVSKYTASAAVAAGAGLSVTTSGYMVTATSGSSVCGRNLDTACASGAVGTGFFNFANPWASVNSNGVL